MHEFKSLDDMLSRSSWSDETFLLQAANTASDSLLWRTESTRNPVCISGQKNFTIDGGKQGITIYGTSLVLYDCKRVTLKNLTIRLGSKGLTISIRKDIKKEFKEADYNGEALKIKGCEDIVIENCSFSWGLDETISIEDTKNAKVRKCIISFPLNQPKNFSGADIWDEDENHAYAALTKGSKDVTYSRCVFAHSITRSPSFSSKGKYDTDATVRHCIIYGFTDEGTKFHDGAESGNKRYKLRIHDNYYSPLIGPNPDRLKEEIAPFPNVDSAKKAAIAIERPDKNSDTVKVEYWRNVIGTRNQFNSNDFSAEKVKPTKIKKNDGDGDMKFDEKHQDEIIPSVPFDEILQEAGPITPTPYTQQVKLDINEGKQLPLLTPHEKQNFSG